MAQLERFRRENPSGPGPWFGLLARVEQNVARVLDALTDSVLRRGLTYEENWRGRVMTTAELLAPVSGVSVTFPADITVPALRVRVLHVEEVGSTLRLSNLPLRWRAARVGELHGAAISLPYGLEDGKRYVVTLLVEV